MIMPKPAHLGAHYANQFEDPSVATAYAARPPYPAELFDLVDERQPPGRHVILDLGCGTGDVALGLVGRAERIDAVDASAAMLAVARGRPGADDPSIRWIHSTAETFEFEAPYSLIIAGESLHWMEWDIVVPKVARALVPRGWLVLADRPCVAIPWVNELGELIARFSTNREYRRYDLVDELTTRGLFQLSGRRTTTPVPFAQSVQSYVESFHSRNGFSRDRMPAGAACAFDEAVRRLVAPHYPDAIVRLPIVAEIAWGLPMPRSQVAS